MTGRGRPDPAVDPATRRDYHRAAMAPPDDRQRVLIVEDEPLIAQRLERFCREILGERLETAAEAALAGKIAASVAVRAARRWAEMQARGETGSIVSLLCDSGERYLKTYFDADWSLARFGDTGAAREQVEVHLHGA